VYDEHRHSRHRSEETAFICQHCKRTVINEAMGTRHRNHCPWCLWSRHLDERVGDRTSACHGDMEPIAIWVKGEGEWSIIHRCRSCGLVRANRCAGDDNEMAMISLAVKPLAHPPFPLEYLIRE